VNQSLLSELALISKKVNATLYEMFIDREPDVLYEASEHLLRAGGKRLRPFLTLKACELVGGRGEDALPLAASIELIHNFTIVHDDIMDNDDRRRNVPTVHVLWGIPVAIIAGDMLFAKAYEAILTTRNVPSDRLLSTIDVVSNATIDVCEGQTYDALFEERRDVSEEEYFTMVYKKTAALLEAAAKVGAIVGGGSAVQVKKLGDLGHYAGLAFQVFDDILGLTADEVVLGKPVGSDIRKGKSTILMIHALEHANETQRTRILDVLGKNEAKTDQIREVIQMVQAVGSMDYAVNKAMTYIEKAKAQLTSFPPSSSRSALTDLCDYIASRNY
jgi:geranylgeranyl diphosphate synthase type I